MLVIRCNPYRAENLSRVFDTYPICRERAGQYRKSKRRSVSGAAILFQSATSLKESLLRCVLSHYFQCVCKCWSVVMTQLSCCSASCEREVNVLRGPSFLTYLFSCLLTAGRNLESADRWNEWMEKKKKWIGLKLYNMFTVTWCLKGTFWLWGTRQEPLFFILDVQL